MPAKRTAKRAAPKRAPRREEREEREERGPLGSDREERKSYGRGRSGGRGGKSDLVRMGGLWARRDRNDNRMYTGSVNVGDVLDYLEQYQLGPEDRMSLLILSNTYKEKDNQPDFNVFGSDPNFRGKGKRGGGSRRQNDDEGDSRGGRGYSRGGGKTRERDEYEGNSLDD